MSDHDSAPDPLDKAYGQAEAMLGDDEARAARRARVLAAVAREGAPAAASGPVRGAAWRRGGWLAAASVAGLGLFLASQFHRPLVHQPLSTPGSAPAVNETAAAPGRSASPPSASPSSPKRTAAAASPPGMTPASPPPLAIPPPPKAFPAAPPPPPPEPEAFAANEGGAADKAAPGRAPDRPTERRESLTAAPSPVAGPASDQADRLRAAAAAGRTADLQTLLDQGAPVDAPDAEGNTALMKAVQSDHPAAAALLRRHGASLDVRNHAGVSTRDMAAAKSDGAIDQAIGTGP